MSETQEIADAFYDRQRIYAKRILIEEDERERIMSGSGYSRATMIDTPTHAICLHGVIAHCNDRHHACSWMRIIARF